MKKSTLFMACCIGLMLFASCKKDPVAPTINMLYSPSYGDLNSIAAGNFMYSGDEITIGFQGKGEKLTKMEMFVSQNGTVLASHSQDLDNLEIYDYWHSFTFEAEGNVNIRGTVTDAAGQTATTEFDIFYKEKPYIKFLGHYEGDALFTGTMEAFISGLDSIQQEVTDKAIPVTLDITHVEGSDLNDVVATCVIDDKTMEIQGTIDGNTISFEATNTTVTFNYDLNGFSVSPEMNITYNVNATLEGEQLNLEGTCIGNGEIHLLFYNGTVALDGIIGGSLTKVGEPE